VSLSASRALLVAAENLFNNPVGLLDRDSRNALPAVQGAGWEFACLES
jgi:hypothetical protein